MVIVLAIGPRVCGFKPGLGGEFLRAIKPRAHLTLEGKYSRMLHVVRFCCMLNMPSKY
jgi:hypothetical protein